MKHTKTFASSSDSSKCYNANFLSTIQRKEIAATQAIGGFRDCKEDPQLKIKMKIIELKHRFHIGRQLLVKHLPRNVTEDEIHELLSGFPVVSVKLQIGCGSPTALAALENCDVLEEWDCKRVFLLRGQRVLVSPAATQSMLCVAKLPLAYTEEQFTSLMQTYGEVKTSFLMISEKSGENKGYGFVDYTSREAALQAKSLLHGKQVDHHILHCDWLDPAHVTFASLHSKCLFIDQLPTYFHDIGELRNIFSAVVSPTYCQIPVKNGCPQNWGLVEFTTSEDAEKTQVLLDGYSLHGQNIRVSYCIPGVRAINLYLELINYSEDKAKETGLLPYPPAAELFQKLFNIAKQTPDFVKNLQNIIWMQIKTQNRVSIDGGTENASAGKGNQSQGEANVSSVSSETAPPLVEYAQIALFILTAARLHALLARGHVYPLDNPQTLAAMYNYIQQVAPPASTTTPLQTSMQLSTFHIQNYKCLHGNIKGCGSENVFVEHYTDKVPLLPNPSMTVSPTPEEITFPALSLDNASVLHFLGVPYITAFWEGFFEQLHRQQSINSSLLDTTHTPQSTFFGHGFEGPKDLHYTDKNTQHKPLEAGKIHYPHYLEHRKRAVNLHQTIDTILNDAKNVDELLDLVTNTVNTVESDSNIFDTREAIPEIPEIYFLEEPVTTVPLPATPMADNQEPILSSQVPKSCPKAQILHTPMHIPPPPLLPRPLLHQEPFQTGWAFLAFPPPPISNFPGSDPGGATLDASPAMQVGQKRKHNTVLPTTQPKYVAQDFQGFGGHYTHSYFKKKKN